MDKKNRERLSLENITAFFLAAMPVLDPYIMYEGGGIQIKVIDVIMIILAISAAFKYGFKGKRSFFLVYWLLGLSIISIFGVIGSKTDAAMVIKNLIVWYMYAFMLWLIWKSPCRELFFKYAKIIGLIVVALALIQTICGHAGIPTWDGRLSIFQLGKYDGWAGYRNRTTGSIRACGLFQEASYAGIYLMVVYAKSLQERRYKYAVAYAVGALVTASMVAIGGIAIATAYILVVKGDRSTADTIKLILIIALVFVGIMILSQYSTTIQSAIQFLNRRFTSFGTDLEGERLGSTKLRLYGHIDFWEKYDSWQKAFGVGIAQYGTMFNVKAYSNVFVTMLLNSGILGTAYFVGCLLGLFKKVNRSDWVYILMFIFVMASDYMWFNGYFFYMITACVLLDGSNQIYHNVEG